MQNFDRWLRDIRPEGQIVIGFALACIGAGALYLLSTRRSESLFLIAAGILLACGLFVIYRGIRDIPVNRELHRKRAVVFTHQEIQAVANVALYMQEALPRYCAENPALRRNQQHLNDSYNSIRRALEASTGQPVSHSMPSSGLDHTYTIELSATDWYAWPVPLSLSLRCDVPPQPELPSVVRKIIAVMPEDEKQSITQNLQGLLG